MERSVLEQMADRGPHVLQLLPSEGLVLEEIIGAMREEYGYPATPQEYRLIVRVAPDEPERHNGGGRPRRSAGDPAGVVAVDPAAGAAATRTDDAEAPGDGSPSPARRGRLRRRRRGRSRGTAVASGDPGQGDAGASGGGGDGNSGSEGGGPGPGPDVAD